MEDYLAFTTETCEDFTDGWLPTLDCSLKVDDDNTILYKFYEKETSSDYTVRKTTAMNEDNKVKVVSNDLIRRLLNTCEKMGKEEKTAVVEGYGQKLTNSGYSTDQVRQILVAGLRGYGSKVVRRKQEGKPLRRTVKESLSARIKRKLLSKTTWYRKGKKTDHYQDDEEGKGRGKKVNKKEKAVENKTVLFVEYTEGGELAGRLRELMKRLAPVIGFGVRVVERTGTSLKNIFPLTNLWDGLQCGREGVCHSAMLS